MSEIWQKPRRNLHPERVAGIVLTLLLLLAAATLTAVVVSLAGQIPAIPLGR